MGAPLGDPAGSPSTDRHTRPDERELVIIPALNEARALPPVLRELRTLHPELDVCVVDDGSRDETAHLARAQGAIVLSHPFNLGYGAALQTGYRYAVRQGYERVVTMDGDGQHPPEEVSRLLEVLRRGEVHVALGSRFLGRGDYQPPVLRAVGMRLFAAIARAATGQAITDPTTGFQALSAEVLAYYLHDFYPHDYPDVEVLIRLHRAGFRFKEVPVRMLPGDPRRSMHRGLRPVYYVYKNAVSIPMALLSSGRAP